MTYFPRCGAGVLAGHEGAGSCDIPALVHGGGLAAAWEAGLWLPRLDRQGYIPPQSPVQYS